MLQTTLPSNLAELRASGWRSRPVKVELRENFIRALAAGDELFPGIVGYDDINISQDSMFSVIWLGIGPTGIATIILFAVIDRAGPTFLSTINYLIPVVAFASGAWLLAEPVSWLHFVALAAILSGIAITRIKANPAPR